MGRTELKILKADFSDKYLTNKLAYPDELFNCIDDYQKLVENFKKKDFFSKLKNNCPSDEKIKGTKEIFTDFFIKKGEKLTRLYLKNDVFLFSCAFEKFMKESINEFDINPLFYVSLPGYTWQCGLKYTGVNLQTLQDKDLILTLEGNKLRGISSVMGDRCVKSDENKFIICMDATIL